jgi:flagellar hook-associated protein 2
MATSLNLGGLSTVGGVSRLLGTNSKLDTEALLTAAYEARRAPAVRLERKIAGNEAKAAALGELRGALEELKRSLGGLRNPPGALGVRENLFEAREAFLSSSTATAPGTLLGIDLGHGAARGSFSLTVDRLATAEKRVSASLAAADTPLADAWNGGAELGGALLVGLAGGAPERVAVDGTMTVLDLRDAINAVSRDSGVVASVIKVADGDHRLVLSGGETGRAIALASETGGDDVLASMGLSQVQAALTSRVTVDGVTVERASNTIDDLHDGMTISLYKAEPGTTVTVGVEPGLGAIKDGIGTFVDAYNAVRGIIDRHNAIDPSGKVGEDAVLFGDRVLRSLSASLSALAGSRATGVESGSLATLRDIGIGFDAGNRLAVDEAVLDRKLLADLDGVRSVLEFGFASSSPELRVLGRSNALADTSFTVDIVDADGDGLPEAASFDGVAASIEGASIKGQPGSAYDGLVLAWAGQGSTSIDVEVGVGIADRLFNALEEALDTLDGPIQRAVGDLETANEAYRRQVARIDERAEAARARLTERFAAMEAALGLADAMLQQVRAQMDAMTASN